MKNAEVIWRKTDFEAGVMVLQWYEDGVKKGEPVKYDVEPTVPEVVPSSPSFLTELDKMEDSARVSDHLSITKDETGKDQTLMKG